MPQVSNAIPTNVVQVIWDLHRHAGNSAQQISRCLRVDFNQVSAILKKYSDEQSAGVDKNYTLGINLPSHAKELVCDLSKDGRSLEEIAEMVGIKTQVVMNILAEVIGISDARLLEIVELRKRGKSLEDISEDTGIDVVFLKLILPETPIENPSLSMIDVILKLQSEGKRVDEMSRELRLSREQVEGFLICLVLSRIDKHDVQSKPVPNYLHIRRIYEIPEVINHDQAFFNNCVCELSKQGCSYKEIAIVLEKE